VTTVAGEITLACPHCGTAGLDNFVYVETIENFRELVRIDPAEADWVTEALHLEAGLLVIRGHYDVADDGDDPRLGCKKCDKECLIPEDLDYDFD
jgi:hypothetical protein